MAESDSLTLLAERLWEARVRVSACEAPSASRPGLNLDDAYQVSVLNYERRLRGGVRPRGKKIGLTSAAVQKQLGVDQPDFGWLTADMEVADGGNIPAATLIQPKVEGEVAFVIKDEVLGPLTRDELLGAVAGVAPCIEVIDSRVRDWKIRIEDTVADNASSAAFVLGPIRPLAGVDLAGASMTLQKNGSVVSSGKGTACLGDPVNAVLWLAKTLGAQGVALKAGDIVLSGAYGPVVAFAPGDACLVKITGLGTVSCAYSR